MMDREMEELWDYMEETGIATSKEMGLAVALCGSNLNTLERVLYIRTGYRSLEQMLEELTEELQELEEESEREDNTWD